MRELMFPIHPLEEFPPVNKTVRSPHVNFTLFTELCGVELLLTYCTVLYGLRVLCFQISLPVYTVLLGKRK